MSQEFHSPPRIITGEGSASAVGAQAQALGATRVIVVTDKVLREKTECVTNAVACLLVIDVGLPHVLADVKISEDSIPALAEESFGNQRLLKNNPRTATVQDLRRILEAASGLRKERR